MKITNLTRLTFLPAVLVALTLFLTFFASFASAAADFSIVFSLENMERSDSESFQVTFINTGDTALNIIANAKVNGNPIGITASLNETNFILDVGQTKIIGLTITTQNADYGDYSVTINATDGISGITKSATQTFSIPFRYCSATSNFFTVSIDNEEDFEGNDFQPYSNLQIKVRIRNNDNEDHDFVVNAALVKDNEIVEDSEVETTITVDEESSKTVTLNLEIPLLEKGRYDVFVRAYDENEEDECNEDSSYIDIIRPSRKVKVVDLMLDKESYNCSENMLISGSIVNIGTNDEEQVKLVYSDDLGNSVEKIFYDLIEGDEETFLFDIAIPANATERQHTFTLKVYYNYRSPNYEKVDTYSYNFNVVGNCIKPIKDGSISISIPLELYVNKEYKGSLLISNTGNLIATYIIELNADWATVKLDTSLVTLNAGEQKIVEFTIMPLQAGMKTLISKIKFDGKEKTATKNIEIKEYQEYTIEESKYKKASWWDELKFEFERKPWVLAIVIVSIVLSIICLIGIIIVLIKR